MKTDSRDLTSGPLFSQILFFSIPLILSNLLQVLFNMSDIAVVGRFCGPAALGSIGSTTTLVTLFTGLQIGMGNGVNVLVAQYYGAGRKDDVREVVHTSFFICTLIGLLTLIFGVFCSRPLLTLMHTKPELLDGAVLYLKIYFLGMPALGIYNFGNGVLSAVGDTKKPLYYLLTAGIVNILLNLFFVIFCHMNVAGVATASVLSQYLSAFLILFSMFRGCETYSLTPSRLKIHPIKAIRLLEIGIPVGMQYAIFQLANLFIQASVNSFDATMVAGNSTAANADALIYDAMAAFYTACSSFIGQSYGAKKKKRVLNSYFVSLLYSFGIGAMLSTILLLCGQQFLGIFTMDQSVIDAGMMRLRIMAFSYAVSSFMDCTMAACRGLGKSVVPTIIVILGSCVFRVIWVYTIFAYFKTIFSLYSLYIFSWSITAAAEIFYFVKIYKKQVAVLP